MKRRWWVVLAAACLVSMGLLSNRSAQAQSKTLYWQRWDVSITNVDTVSNRFDVAEIHDIQFTSGQFTFGFRSIPNRERVEQLTNIRVREGETYLTPSCSRSRGTFCVSQVGSELEVVYYFLKPALNERRVFTIEYQVVGGLRYYEDGDQIDWYAVAPDHNFPIQSSTVTVCLPIEYAPRDSDPVASYPATSITRQRDLVTFATTRSLGSDESLEVRVQYPHNPDGRVASWQASFDRQVRLEPVLNLLFGGGALVVLLVGPLLIYYRWYSRGRDPEVGVVPEYISEPPSDLPPALAGTLVDETADMRDVMSTLIDLARRGYLIIEEERNEGFLGIGGSSDFTFKRTEKESDALRGYERLMLTKIFNRKKSATMASLRNKFYKHIPRIQKGLYEEVVREGYFSDSPQAIRSRWTGGGAVLLFVAIFAGAFSAPVGGELGLPATLFCLPISFGIVAVVMMIAGSRMPAKTEKGSEESAKWNAFRNYLKNIRDYTDLTEATDQFNDYFPYAVAFGLERSWVNTFSRVASTPIPYWYYPRYMGGPWSHGYRGGSPVDMRSPDIRSQLAGSGGSLNDMSRGISGGLNQMSSGLVSMLNNASSTMNSRPSSSSGGGGFSGGFSGGGGGGGGGSAGFG